MGNLEEIQTSSIIVESVGFTYQVIDVNIALNYFSKKKLVSALEWVVKLSQSEIECKHKVGKLLIVAYISRKENAEPIA